MQAQKEIYQRPKVDGVNTVHVQGVTGKTTSKRLDTLEKLQRAGKITHVQFCAGMDYLRVVEAYFATASGLAKLSEEAGQVGGVRDPINRYLKARPVRLGYVPTQRPRRPSQARSHGDGWTPAKLAAMGEFGRMANLVERLPTDQRRVLCMIVIDPSSPDRRPVDINRAGEIMYGYRNQRIDRRVIGLLIEALDVVDAELRYLQAA